MFAGQKRKERSPSAAPLQPQRGKRAKFLAEKKSKLLKAIEKQEGEKKKAVGGGKRKREEQQLQLQSREVGEKLRRSEKELKVIERHQKKVKHEVDGLREKKEKVDKEIRKGRQKCQERYLVRAHYRKCPVRKKKQE